jgi:hypothetical protein
MSKAPKLRSIPFVEALTPEKKVVQREKNQTLVLEYNSTMVRLCLQLCHFLE